MMKLLPDKTQYQEILSLWAGHTVKFDDDFNLVCESDFDFIEILMLFEKEFFLNLLDSEEVRHNFGKVDDFISWAVSQPYIEQSFVYSLGDNPKVLHFSEVNDQ